MSIFSRLRKQPQFPPCDSTRQEPVLRCSICTGEETACLQDKTTGKLQEICLIQNKAELAAFMRAYSLTSVRQVY
ncbi:MAG: hypothetical protein IJP62_07160 [Treponema sp.]|nr:hypothetical protein [Treponema sp.]